MKKFYTLLFLMCAMSLLTVAQEKKPLIEDYSILVEEQGGTYLYHYVMAYTSDGWRSSENIYRSLKSGKTFLQEELYDVGKYTYEFDTQGRVKVKDVKYEKGNMQSYRIIADYSASPVSYTKYDGDLSKIASWTCHDNGALASYTFHVDDPETGGRAGTTVYYGENGELLSDATAYTLNEGTVEYDGGVKVHYKYDGKFGRLLEYTQTGSDYPESVVLEYDSFGRVTKVTQTDEDETYVGTFEYFNDEVYHVGNSWYDVFAMDGPLTKLTVKAPEGNYIDYTFSRDTNGKLLSIKGSWGEWDSADWTVKDGHIVGLTYIDNDQTKAYTHTWSGEDLTEMNCKTTGKDPSGTYSYDERWTFKHSPGKLEENCYENSSFSSKRTVEEDGTTFIMNYWDSYSNSIFVKRTIQQEDFSVKRPDIGADLAGFCPERPILIGVKGRVICTGKDSSSYPWNYILCDNENGSFVMNNNYFVNSDDDEFFNIHHDGATTTCVDAYDRPVFETENERLMREYIYDDSDGNSQMSAPKRVQRKKAGETGGELKDVTVITYNYNAEGLCTGQTIAVYDSDGTSEQKDVAYTYTTGIKEVTTKSTSVLPRKIIKDGRVVIVRDGNCYNVAGIEVQH